MNHLRDFLFYLFQEGERRQVRRILDRTQGHTFSLPLVIAFAFTGIAVGYAIAWVLS